MDSKFKNADKTRTYAKTFFSYGMQLDHMVETHAAYADVQTTAALK